MPLTLPTPPCRPGHVSAAGDDRADDQDGLELVPPGHPARPALEAFIGAQFARTYGARLAHFCHTLAGHRDAHGRWVAAPGYTPASDDSLFLEQYLDLPVETAIAGHVGHPIARIDVVEVGNLAAIDAGAGRRLIVAMTRHLHRQGLAWVTFTATRARCRPGARPWRAPAAPPGGCGLAPRLRAPRGPESSCMPSMRSGDRIRFRRRGQVELPVRRHKHHKYCFPEVRI